MSFTWATRSRAESSLTLDTGHFHPTESVADKISAVLLHVPRLSCTSAGASDGTATTSCVADDSLLDLAEEIGRAAGSSGACTWGWTISTPASTASPRG